MRRPRYEIDSPELMTGTEAALMLGITFRQFKVELWRGCGREKNRRAPRGFMPPPVRGSYFGRQSLYRVADIRRFGLEHNFTIKRNVETGEREVNGRPYKDVKSASLRRFLYALGREEVIRILQQELGTVPLPPKPKRPRKTRKAPPAPVLALTGWKSKVA